MTDWMRDLLHAGLSIHRSLIPQELFLAATELIQARLRVDIPNATSSDIDTWTRRSFVPSLESDRRLLDLYYQSPLASMVSEAAGPLELAPVVRAQVQVRLSGPRASVQPVKQWHCDGVNCARHPAGTLDTFQLLIGILLSEVSSVDAGAVQFRVGGHKAIAEFFAGGGVLPEGVEVPDVVEGLPIVPMVGLPGDVVIAHHLCPHTVGPNRTSTDRIMLYFRVKVVDHDLRYAQIQLGDPWVGLPGLRQRLGL